MKVLAALLAGGCIGAPEGQIALPVLDFDSFESEVQPILAERCANPSCHGRPDRPLAVYAPGRYRLDPERAHLDEPITSEELTTNFVRACGFTVGLRAAGECLLLTKPLAVEAGGVGHVGGDVWTDRRESEYRALEAWLSTLLARTEEGNP